jgi:hypothetical protein
MSRMVENLTDVSEEHAASISMVCLFIACTSRPTMKTLRSWETAVNFYHAKQRHTSEYSSLNKEFTST